MCGICGQYDFGNNKAVNLEEIKKMTQELYHRGPDDKGYYISGSLGLGFRRLSIIDLDGGHQPMSDNEETVWIVFNGEIYNFHELRDILIKEGHVFKNKSDTEVIIHGYKQWGIDVLNKLKGMFGLAIWDERKQKLIIARDAMGMKLLYYKIESGKLYFASEIRSITSLNKGNKKIDPVALNLFLRYRYTPSPYTMHEGIKKLAPGTMMIFEKAKSQLMRWYNYTPKPFKKNLNDNEIKEELLYLYKKAVKRHLISDVPVGLLLSGGVDSGLLLGLTSLYGNDYPTYTVGYGASFKDDELEDAKETAKIFKANNYSVLLNKDQFEASLRKIVTVIEEPIASSSIVPMYFVCERARKDVKVALVGQGPDELFGGYTRHLGVKYGNIWRKLPKNIRNIIYKLGGKITRNEAINRAVYSLDIEDQMIRYQNIFSILSKEGINNLFKPDLIENNTGDEILKCWKDLETLMKYTDELGGFKFLEMRSSLPDELLMYSDKISMAHSLEVRVPYIDRDIVEFVERLPDKYMIRYGNRKWIHKKVCNSFLPKTIINRKKRGFAVNVVDSWFNESISDKFNMYLTDKKSKMYEYLKYNEVNMLYNLHKTKKQDNHKILFSLIVFEEWLRANDM
jgi:asparagine synthase (glutamine-hydrolysing)